MTSEIPLEIHERMLDGRARLELVGELDIATVPRLAQAVDAIIARGAGELTIDLRKLAFLDSSGLRELIVLRDRAIEENWKLTLTRPSQPTLSIFQITRAEEHLPFIEESEPR